MKYIPRHIEAKILHSLVHFPSIAIVGPRQCGKTTLVKHIDHPDKIYIDLENRTDRAKLGDPFIFFDQNKDRLICLDEVQFLPDIFVDIKSSIDTREQNGQFLLLGSASPILLKQSSESMAGRIIYHELYGFLWSEVKTEVAFETYLFNGQLPKALLSESDSLSQQWSTNYLSTFFQRDLLQLAPGVTSYQVERLFTMMAHNHGQELNANKLSKSLGIAYNTVKKYIELMLWAYQLFLIPPYSRNTGKRIIKSPKLYLSDTGNLHAQLNIRSFNDLLGHPVFGFSFEGVVIYNIIKQFPQFNYSFYKTSAGAELDLVIETGKETIGVEIKASKTPKTTRGFRNALEDVNASIGWVIGWIDYKTQLRENVFQSGLEEFVGYLEEL